jgi:hypothetical protein
MEILALKLFVPEDDVNRLLAEHVPKDVPVRKLNVRLTPEGVRVAGEYPTVFMSVAFETLWKLAVVAGRLDVQLGDLKVSGFPAAMLRGVIFKMLKESAPREPGLSVEGESLQIDLEQFLAAKGLPLKVNLRDVVCSVGNLVIEAGTGGVVA